jgi:acyl carrier protein
MSDSYQPVSAGPQVPLTSVGEIEGRVIAAAREALQRDDIDLSTPFGELGGNSILAAVVVARVWESCGIRMPLSALTKSTSLAGFVQALVQHSESET